MHYYRKEITMLYIPLGNLELNIPKVKTKRYANSFIVRSCKLYDEK